MNNYITLPLGFSLGQLFTTVIAVYILQYKKPVEYNAAFKAYVKSEQAGYVVAFVALLVIMFILPDYVDPVKGQLKEDEWKWKIRIMKNFRFFTIIAGMFAPLISLVLFKKGIKAIQRENAKIDMP